MSYTKLVALVALAASAAMAQGTIYCASDDMRRHYCAADTRGGVNVARQRSDASCIAGRTWGYDGRGIWVDRGCRADFALSSYNAGGYGQSGPYNSRNSGPYYGGNSGPYYGGSNSGPYYGSGGYGNSGGASRITCESNDMRRHYCSAATSGGVQLVRQHSQAACIEGRTWGYSRSGVWVDQGCRAEFAVNTSSNGSYNGNARRGRYNNYNYTDPNRGAWRPW